MNFNKLLKAFVILFITFLLGIQTALYYSERVDLEETRHIPHCTNVSDPAYSTQISTARAILKSMMQVCNTPALSVALSVNRKLIWSEAYGNADVDTQTQACPNTIFRIGSISKTLTAVALLRLVEQGKINPDEDIRNILPEFPDKGFAITPLQLATHTAGIRPYRDDSEALVTQHYASAIESLDRFKNDPLVFEPGTGFEYSNYGFVLLSAVMEKASKKNFMNIMHDEVFVPLGMQSSGAERHDSTIQHKSTFYDDETPYSSDGQLHKSPFINYSSKWASGGFLSTAEDLVKFSDALDLGFLTNSSIKLMYHPHASQFILNYGLGWMIARDPYLRKAYFHFGAGSGATSVLVKFPGYNTNLVILSNLGHAKFPYKHLMGVINEFIPRTIHWLFYTVDFFVLAALLLLIKRKFW